MDVSQVVFQIALILVPSGAVLITVIYFMRREAQKELRNAQIELRKERQKFFLPNRVDAYQRIILLMERIHPNSLVMRHNNPGMPAAAMQVKLLEAIRSEYEHNIAQQMFISQATWDLVRKSKDETVKIIHLAGQQLDATATGMELSAKIFEIVGEIGELPSDIAVRALKEEIQALF